MKTFLLAVGVIILVPMALYSLGYPLCAIAWLWCWIAIILYATGDEIQKLKKAAALSHPPPDPPPHSLN
jgi:hypothetical protein